MPYDIVYDMHIRYRTSQTYDIAWIYWHTISYTLWIHCVVWYCMLHIRHRMLTYDIVKTYDITIHTISYVQQSNIVYTISYDMVYDIQHRTYDIVCPDIRYRTWHTILYVARIQMLVQASYFFNHLVLLKCFYAVCLISLTKLMHMLLTASNDSIQKSIWGGNKGQATLEARNIFYWIKSQDNADFSFRSSFLVQKISRSEAS